MSPSSPSESQAASGDRCQAWVQAQLDRAPCLCGLVGDVCLYPDDMAANNCRGLPPGPVEGADDAQVEWLMEMHGNTITHLSVDGVTLIGQRHGDHNPTGKLHALIRNTLVSLNAVTDKL